MGEVAFSAHIARCATTPSNPPRNSTSTRTRPVGNGECDLCCDEAEDHVKFSCGAKSCKTCFDIYLTGKIQKSQTQFISCPGFKCIQLNDDGKRYCRDQGGYESHHQQVVEVSEKWKLSKKTCLKCRTQIEKNGCCNHMTCGLATCGHEFCWICLRDWTDHGYKCRKYQKDADESRTKAEIDLKKFTSYHDLYRIHQKSIEFNEKLRKKVNGACETIATSKRMTFSELQYFPKAVDSLLKCRTTLMYSYAFAYFLEDSLNKTIFEDIQVDMEKAVEGLNEYLAKENLEKTTSTG
ncbi:hypothetical protein L596_004016 [Steinernema carpocapsae]|uniref:RBR-type E3 ubiquitin transferase n=1 Tax=Steinernema carpocapsae TaxID=34508 RepID=A0A4U8UUI0_STECR|nr:hypothetical protein L596_004016 [Steinernema carpocapsae]